MTPWTDTDTRTLRRLAAQSLTARQIGDRMHRDSRHINERAKRHGIQIRRIRAKRPWSPQDIAQLRHLYPTHTAKQIAAAMSRSVSSINARAAQLGLHKPEGYAAEITRQRWRQGANEGSRKHHFHAQQTPWNKGKPGSTGLHPNSRAHHFQPGHLDGKAAHNLQPIGAERTSKDGQLQRKTHNGQPPQSRWSAVTRLVWEAEHGPIPAGHVVRFRPGQHTTVEAEITLDKLECITQRENMRRNSRHTNYPPELNRVMQLRGALTRKINNQGRKDDNNNHR